jgi:polar amino acid transport system substrate-binding protein
MLRAGISLGGNPKDLRIALALALAAGCVSAIIGAAPASASTVLDRIKAAGKIELGYREDAGPFSYKNDQGQAAGYSVEICQVVVDDLKADLGLSNLAVDWVPVTLDDRFEAVQAGKVDLLCGAETATLSRRKQVSFSIPILNSGIGALVRADTPIQLRKILNGEPAGPVWRGSPARLLEKRTFAVVGGTTTEKWLADILEKFQITANVTPVESYNAGVAQLLDRGADVLVGDRPILMDVAQSSPQAGDLTIIDRTFTAEPIALSLDRNDEDFRLAVDTSLSKLFRSDGFRDIYRKWFGEADAATLDFFHTTALAE